MNTGHRVEYVKMVVLEKHKDKEEIAYDDMVRVCSMAQFVGSDELIRERVARGT